MRRYILVTYMPDEGPSSVVVTVHPDVEALRKSADNADISDAILDELLAAMSPGHACATDDTFEYALLHQDVS